MSIELTKHTNSIALLTGQHSDHIDELTKGIGIHQQVKKPWLALQQAAKSAGFELEIASGFRSFDRQLLIWNKKFNRQLLVKDKNNQVIDLSKLNDENKVEAILLYSALPGASRHHWGTDLDIYASNLLPQGKSLQLEPWEYQSTGYFAELTQWLTEHAEYFGFFRPYDIDRGGVAIEPWHFSYAPLALQYQQKLTVTLLERVLTKANICGKSAILKRLTNIHKRYIINTNKPQNLGKHIE